jgi:hypothetical protein
LARSERYDGGMRRAQHDHAVAMQLLGDNQDSRNAAQQRANAEAMRNMKDGQARRDEVRRKVMLELQAAVSAIGNRPGMAVAHEPTVTTSGGQTEDLLGDIVTNHGDAGTTIRDLTPCFPPRPAASSANTSDNYKDEFHRRKNFGQGTW